MNTERRLTERVAPGVYLSYEIKAALASEQSPYQELTVVEGERFGRMLLLDGVMQTTVADEFVYHEMLAHVPLLAHGAPADVLIVGGGDCGLAEEILKHGTVQHLTHVEIDARVVALAREHLGEINAGVFDDPRYELHIGDGAAFMAESTRQFDVVLIDSTDPVGAAKPIFTLEFYQAVRRRLKPGGLLVVQAGVPFLQSVEFQTTMRNLSAAFPLAGCYLLASPTYFGGHMTLAWASETLSPGDAPLPELKQRFDAVQIETRYYTPAVHLAAFALPAFILRLIPPATPGKP
jgi:spermidine synthase